MEKIYLKDTIKYVNTQFYASNHTIVFRSVVDTVITKYLYYYFKLCVPLENFLNGTVIKEIRGEDFNNISIVIPTIETQYMIIHTLDTMLENVSINLYDANESFIDTLKNTIKQLQLKGKQFIEDTVML